MRLLPRATKVIGTTFLLAFVMVGCSSQGEILSVYEQSESALAVTVDTCNQDPTIRVEETPNDVTLYVSVQKASTGSDCLDGVDVKLESPLDGRAVYDGGTGERLEVEKASSE